MVIPEKPVNLRKDTWEFLLEKFKSLNPEELSALLLHTGYQETPLSPKEDVLESIAKNPAPFLMEIGLIEQTPLLENTVIELKDEVEYLLDQQAAIALKEHRPTVTLKRVYDGERRSFSYYTVLDALRHSPAFDQLKNEPDDVRHHSVRG